MRGYIKLIMVWGIMGLSIRNVEGFFLPFDADSLRPSLFNPSASVSYPFASEPFFLTLQDSQPPVTEKDIENLIRQIIQKREPNLVGQALEQRVQEELASWLSLKEGIMITEILFNPTSMIATRQRTEWKLNYNVNEPNQYLSFAVIEEAGDFTKFDKLRFYVKGDTNRFRLRFDYFDDAGMPIGFTVKMKDLLDKKLVENLVVDKDKYQPVEIDLKRLRKEYSEVNWQKIRSFGFELSLEDFPVEEDPPPKPSGVLFLKDVNFVPGEDVLEFKEKLFSLNEMA
ncbi:MAG: hypothetical protein ACK4NT_05840, partial [Candidatus Omnitrophota bacterium]